MIEPGLRERKKQATRDAMHAAALRLAVARGVAHVTAEDIAHEAGVAPRTFFNHFASKEEAFVADDLARGADFVARIAAAPDDAPVWPLLARTARDVFGGTAPDSREQALKEQLVRTSPAVVAHVLGAFARLEEDLVVELSRRTAPSPPLHARLLAGVVVAALRAAAEAWLEDEHATAADFADLLDDAFAALAPAFP